MGGVWTLVLLPYILVAVGSELCGKGLPLTLPSFLAGPPASRRSQRQTCSSTPPSTRPSCRCARVHVRVCQRVMAVCGAASTRLTPQTSLGMFLLQQPLDIAPAVTLPSLCPFLHRSIGGERRPPRQYRDDSAAARVSGPAPPCVAAAAQPQAAMSSLCPRCCRLPAAVVPLDQSTANSASFVRPSAGTRRATSCCAPRW